jgi:hypothetical protein
MNITKADIKLNKNKTSGTINKDIKEWRLRKSWRVPGMAKFVARRVLPDSDRGWASNAQNALSAALNGEFHGHIPKPLKLEDRYGIHIRYPLMRQHIWVSGKIRKPNKFVWLKKWILPTALSGFGEIPEAISDPPAIWVESSAGSRSFPQ